MHRVPWAVDKGRRPGPRIAQFSGRDRVGRMGRAALTAALFGLCASPSIARAPDAAKVMGPGKCAECHRLETKAWKDTYHSKSFKKLPRAKAAKKIAKAMGYRRMKAGELCMSCHFTNEIRNGRKRPTAGVACESCHGGAKNWIRVHSGFSGKKKNTESKGEMRRRWAKAEGAGMIRPDNLYQLSKNCFSCHLVSEEKLVNEAGHPAGSPFELVSWSQGEIRHNTWYNRGKQNEPAGKNRSRMLYVVGAAVELEMALRGLATAKKRARYSVTMANRAAIALLRMKRLARATRDANLIQIVNAAISADLSLNNSRELVAAANAVAEAARRFASRNNGSRLAAVDRYLPGQREFKGKARPPR